MDLGVLVAGVGLLVGAVGLIIGGLQAKAARDQSRSAGLHARQMQEDAAASSVEKRSQALAREKAACDQVAVASMELAYTMQAFYLGMKDILPSRKLAFQLGEKFAASVLRLEAAIALAKREVSTKPVLSAVLTHATTMDELSDRLEKIMDDMPWWTSITGLTNRRFTQIEEVGILIEESVKVLQVSTAAEFDS